MIKIVKKETAKAIKTVKNSMTNHVTITPLKCKRPMKGRSYTSQQKTHDTVYTDAMPPGDRIMTIASKIKLVSYINGQIDQSYVLLGVVKH